MMKIGISMFSPTAYGAGRVVLEYARALARKGHSPVLLFDRDPKSIDPEAGSIIPDLIESGIEARQLPGLTGIRAFADSKTRRIIDELQLEIIISTQLRDAPAIAALARWNSCRFVMLVQNPPRFSGSWPLRSIKGTIYRRAVQAAELVVCVSDEIVEILSRWRSGSTVSVLNAVQIPDQKLGIEARRQIRASFGVRDEDRMIIAVGRIHPQKDPITMMEAIRSIHGITQHRFVLVVVGTWRAEQNELAREVQRIASTMGNDVVFAGFRNDVPDLLQASDLFILTSRFEGGPSLAALEAMAAGLPAILTDHGSRLSGFQDGVQGQYVPVGSPHSIGAAVEKFVNHPDAALKSAGSSARDYVKQHRSLSRAKADFVELIEQAGRLHR